jgi:hypothetical protein
MRLIEPDVNGNLSLVEHYDANIPRYAILSHRWREQEVLFHEFDTDNGKTKAGYAKIRFCADQAARHGLKAFWIDTCCINKTNAAELSESIISMFRWYQNAERCYAYLDDVVSGNEDWESQFIGSEWFSRGWTLQELLAPSSVEFFAKDGTRLGDKVSLQQQIHKATGIAISALQGSILSSFSIAERKKWAANRKTTRPEDKAYSLLGIFNVSMAPLYGEGEEQAMGRLEKEIDPPKVVPCSTVPFRRDSDFVDRECLVKQVTNSLSVPASRVSLVGLGGVG